MKIVIIVIISRPAEYFLFQQVAHARRSSFQLSQFRTGASSLLQQRTHKFLTMQFSSQPRSVFQRMNGIWNEMASMSDKFIYKSKM
jgi:hypothetical protein